MLYVLHLSWVLLLLTLAPAYAESTHGSIVTDAYALYRYHSGYPAALSAG